MNPTSSPPLGLANPPDPAVQEMLVPLPEVVLAMLGCTVTMLLAPNVTGLAAVMMTVLAVAAASRSNSVAPFTLTVSELST
jgi:hypothetical protein